MHALQGKVIAVTRPEAQAAALGEGIRALGGVPYYFPLLEIAPVTDPGALQRAAAALEAYQFAIFVSPNAVTYALPYLLEGRVWPVTLRPVAVGSETARTLAEAGVMGCLYPRTRYDSEALLELPELAPDQVCGKEVLLLRGNGGRELLGQTLEQRGARVHRVCCYRRYAPLSGRQAFVDALKAARIHGICISSSEALRNLYALAVPPELVTSLPLFVSHDRIAAQAREMGFDNVILKDAASGGMLAGLSEYGGSW